MHSQDEGQGADAASARWVGGELEGWGNSRLWALGSVLLALGSRLWLSALGSRLWALGATEESLWKRNGGVPPPPDSLQNPENTG